MNELYVQLSLMAIETLKTCPKCGEPKPRSAFSIHRGKHDGLQSWCKACLSEHAAAKYRENPQIVRERIQRSIARNPERRREVARRYYHNHREAVLARVDKEKRRIYMRANYPANKARIYRNNAAYRERHPEANQLRKARRRAYKSGAAINDFTCAEWLALLEAHQHRCAYCGCAPKVLTQDHVIPLSRGGNHTKSNIVPACQPCNSSKSNKTPEEWYGSCVSYR